ncbi:MAG: U32 family peptidase C-terminal domain-containing protein, partial [Lachnospiraceae bacterium]|nr:U32 family peptidase C-terminal domain-containing protein [Lachnospiraceae bacterium]
TGFFFNKPKADAQIYDSNVYVKDYTFFGIIYEITKDGYALMEQRNKFCLGDVLEIMEPDGKNLSVKVLDMRDEDGNPMESCPHPQQKFYVKFSELPKAFDLVRGPSKSGDN